MTKGNKNKSRSHGGGKSKDELERKRDERARRNALKKEREAKEYLENDENFVSFSNQLQAVGYKIKDIKGDGNCLFRSLADQLDGDDSGHLRYRRITAKYLADHREEFEPFVEDNKSFDEHVKELSKPGTYGGNDSIVAFSRCHGVNIVIHQLNERCWVIHGEQYSTSKPGETAKELHISYHNGDHYSSVRRINDPGDGPAWEFNNKQKVNEKTTQSVPNDIKFSKKKPKSKNDEETPGLEASLPQQSDLSDVAIVQAATGCKDIELIQQSLCESNNDMDATISYILQLQSFVDVEESDQDKSPSRLGGTAEHANTSTANSGAEHKSEDECPQPAPRKPQNSKAYHGARPKIRQQHVSNSKRKQMAKQEKKARRMEERREEAQKRQEPQTAGNQATNQAVPTMVADLDALAI